MSASFDKSVAYRKRVELGPVTLYLGDAREIVPTLTGEVDLLATDPPYGIKYQSNFSGEKFDVIHGDSGEVDVPAILVACVKKLTKQRHVYVFGPAALLEGVAGLTSPVALIWDKENIGMGDLSLPWGPGHEPIHFAVHIPSAAHRAMGKGRLAARMRQGSVIRARRLPQRTLLHPHEKPVDLLRRIVEASSCLDETVLDPFMGCGSTVIAALVSGRRAIGIEIDERYFDEAVDRVQRIMPTLQLLESA